MPMNDFSISDEDINVDIVYYYDHKHQPMASLYIDGYHQICETHWNNYIHKVLEGFEIGISYLTDCAINIRYWQVKEDVLIGSTLDMPLELSELNGKVVKFETGD